jgi:hypothetical protein
MSGRTHIVHIAVNRLAKSIIDREHMAWAIKEERSTEGK